MRSEWPSISVHLAQASRGVDLRGLFVDNVADALAAGLEDALAGLDCFHHGQPVGYVVRHGLLAVDILAGGNDIEHHAAVLEIGDGHDHGVHILAIQQRAVILGGGNLAPQASMPAFWCMS